MGVRGRGDDEQVEVGKFLSKQADWKDMVKVSHCDETYQDVIVLADELLQSS